LAFWPALLNVCAKVPKKGVASVLGSEPPAFFGKTIAILVASNRPLYPTPDDLTYISVFYEDFWNS
jgi:hypothetical protein